jgi:hypothetical protein
MGNLRIKLLTVLTCAALGCAMSGSAFAGRGNRGGDDAEAPGNSGNAPGHNGSAPGNSGNAPGHGGTQPGGNHGHGPRLSPHSLDICPDSDASLVGPEGQAGQSQVAHVEFAVADASDDATADESAPWARMTYFWVGTHFDFIFNAHQLTPSTAYTLIVAADDGSAVCLASGTVNNGGELHLMGSVDPDASFPQDLDPFAPRTDDTEDATAKLVPSASVDCDAGTVSAPDADAVVLTSETGVRYVDVDTVECPAAE